MFTTILEKPLAALPKAAPRRIRQIRSLKISAISRASDHDRDQHNPPVDPSSSSSSSSSTLAEPSRPSDHVNTNADQSFQDFESGVPPAFSAASSTRTTREPADSSPQEVNAESEALRSLGQRFSSEDNSTVNSDGKPASDPLQDFFDLTKSFGGPERGEKDRFGFKGNKTPNKPFNSLSSLEDTNFVQSPRSFKGVQDRHRRQLGAAPAEAKAFNEILNDMFKDLVSGDMNKGGGMGAGIGDPFGLGLGGSQWGGGGRGAVQAGRRRLFSREENEADAGVLQEIDAMKEEMSSIDSEVELLEWAKKKVFTPVSVDEFGPTFSRAYSAILAHLLKTARTNFGNPHLALALFQHAQSHSLESYLSGCLAATYNELISVRWESFKDFEGVEQSVREMQSNGVNWDRGTQKLVGSIVADVMQEVAATSGRSRWGSDIHARLRALDELVQGDIDKQEDIWNQQREVKSQIRRSGGFGIRNRDQGVDDIRAQGAAWSN